MALKGALRDWSAWNKFLVLILLVLFGLGLNFVLLYGLNAMFFHLPATFLSALTSNPEPEYVRAAKVVQMAFQVFGFLLPAVFAAFLFSDDMYRSYWYREKTGFVLTGLAIATIVLLLPGINYLALFNEQMHLPGVLKSVEEWMRSAQEENDRLVELFVVMNGPSDFVLNLFVMALVPALSEEFLFRGVLQKLFTDMTKSPVAGIVIAAGVFSAFHMQFFGFIPRFLLGLAFGFMLYWSGNIWYAVFAHFVNNLAALIIALIYGPELALKSPSYPESAAEWLLVGVITLLGLYTFSVFRKTAK